jgi:hypothetical protein
MYDLGEKGERNRKKYSCETCYYFTYNKSDYMKHITTRKHIESDKGEQKGEIFAIKGDEPIAKLRYSCEVCKYTTHDKTKYGLHLGTVKHIKNTSNVQPVINTQNAIINIKTQIVTEPVVTPQQNMDTCNEDASCNMMITKDVFYALLKNNQELIKDNQDFKNMMMEQNKQIIELSTKNNIITNTNNNNNNITNNNTINNNQKFNLNFFLNEQCKDAMNLSEFVDSIDVSIQDLEYVGEHGYINGITKIIMDNLNQLDLYKRPIHCTDIKREVIHIKDNDKWERDTDDNEKMKRFIALVGNKNSSMVYPWQLQNPEYEILDSPKYNQWLRLAMCSNEYSKEKKNHEAILRNISRKIYLDKNEIMNRGNSII